MISKEIFIKYLCSTNNILDYIFINFIDES